MRINTPIYMLIYTVLIFLISPTMSHAIELERRIQRTNIATNNLSSLNKMAKIADIFSKADTNSVQVSTNKGKGPVVFSEGETIKFYIKVKIPLHVYIYSIDSTGYISLLFPGDGDSSRKMRPYNVYSIPPEHADWRITAHHPFGVEIIKVFASERIIPQPELNPRIKSHSFSNESGVSIERVRTIVRERVKQKLVGVRSINPLDLVDYFRGSAMSSQTELFENSVTIQTQKNSNDTAIQQQQFRLQAELAHLKNELKHLRNKESSINIHVNPNISTTINPTISPTISPNTTVSPSISPSTTVNPSTTISPSFSPNTRIKHRETTIRE